MTLRGLLFLFGALALFLASAVGQEFRGTINGRVTDRAGAGIPAAKVTVKNAGTNEQTVVNTSDSGDYTAPFVMPGKYVVSVEAKGFKQASRDGVEVRVNEKVTVNFQMEVGA